MIIKVLEIVLEAHVKPGGVIFSGEAVIIQVGCSCRYDGDTGSG